MSNDKLVERLELYAIALTHSMRSEEERARLGDLRVGPHMAAEAFTEAAAHIARLTSALEWQPIETAPKDGTSILAIWMWGDDLNPHAGETSHNIVYWESGRWLTISGELPPVPTDWMALPAPPGSTHE